MSYILCSNCNVHMRSISDFRIHVYDYMYEAIENSRGMCLSASKDYKCIDILPVPYVCPSCHKIEFYLSEEDYAKVEDYYATGEN